MKASGFDDLEDTRHEQRPLLAWHSLKWTKRDAGQIQAQAQYYRDATAFLNEHDFTDDHERLIWFLHSEGLSVREIEREISYSRNHVHKIITQLREVMRDRNENE